MQPGDEYKGFCGACRTKRTMILITYRFNTGGKGARVGKCKTCGAEFHMLCKTDEALGFFALMLGKAGAEDAANTNG
jgi:hypothetical protein